MNNAKEQIAADKVVTFHYTLKNKAGDVLDSSSGGDPLTYLHGHSQIVLGLEKALLGKISGDKVSAHVEAKEGYGEHFKELVMTLPKNQGKLPDGIGIGDMLELRSPDGERIPARILEITEKDIIVDANHPLAGEDLFFDVEVTGIRVATEQELTHGHAHGEQGADH
jgi:FKBP-type peptidyl-prolyl cis-trans isomerase SlyD